MKQALPGRPECSARRWIKWRGTLAHLVGNHLVQGTLAGAVDRKGPGQGPVSAENPLPGRHALIAPLKALLALRANRTHRGAARADRPTQSASCAPRKPHPSRGGATQVIFEPLDFIAKLAALVPRPRVNLTRYHGVFAPNSQYRAQVTPGRRGRSETGPTPAGAAKAAPVERRASMTWAQRLKRVFNIDIASCRECGGAVKVIACIEDPAIITKILSHLDQNATSAEASVFPQSRARPGAGLFG